MSHILKLQCSSCGAPMGSAGFAPLAVRCLSCAASEQVRIDADGVASNVADPDPSLDQLSTWVRALRAVASGDAVCLGGCRRCRGPLTEKGDAPVQLLCAHCGARRDVALGTVVSQPLRGLRGSMRSNLGGEASFDLDYAIEREEATSLGEHECPRCGAPVPAGHGSDDCGYCSGPLWMTDAEGRRYTYVLSFTGHRGVVPVDERHSLHGAEQVIDRHVGLVRDAFSRAARLRIVLAVVLGSLLLLGLTALFAFMRHLKSSMEEFGP